MSGFYDRDCNIVPPIIARGKAKKDLLCEENECDHIIRKGEEILICGNPSDFLYVETKHYCKKCGLKIINNTFANW